MGHCQRWDCRWHGRETGIYASMCDYCALHSQYNIPDEDKIRGCEGCRCDSIPKTECNIMRRSGCRTSDGQMCAAAICTKYDRGDAVTYYDNTNGLKRTVVRAAVSERRITAHQRLYHAEQLNKQIEEIKKDAEESRKSERYGMRIEIDGKRAQLLYDEGKNDLAIARTMGVSGYAVRRWREMQQLPPQHRFDDEACARLMELHATGMTDKEIAAAMGVSRNSVNVRRNRMGLQVNRSPRRKK